ncbi:hypothetical protein [Streptomyces subrutilus]|uniref:hypothetical protein n=1 Tax=Streptomyces subrutilus TaxID=36818 RepID=UPI00142FEC78|nr:hypothetical protein [Streptomyces subrutilus]
MTKGSRGGSQLTSTSMSWKSRASSVTITAAADRASCASVLIGTPRRRWTALALRRSGALQRAADESDDDEFRPAPGEP